MSLSSGIRFNVGKSKAKVQMEPQTGVTFADVAGCDGSKLELNEIVEFLKNPGKFSALGAKIPSGVTEDSFQTPYTVARSHGSMGGRWKTQQKVVNDVKV